MAQRQGFKKGFETALAGASMAAGRAFAEYRDEEAHRLRTWVRDLESQLPGELKNRYDFLDDVDFEACRELLLEDV
jgi:hypothetical protein